MTMIRTQVYIPEELYLRAKAKALSDGSSISVVLREGLQETLKPPRRSKRGLTPIQKWLRDFKPIHFDGPSMEAARDHNDIYDL